MKSEAKILIAFLLNLLFSVFEFAGGILTGSVAILSDSLHDMGDAASIGISYFLERKSKRPADGKFTYGYARYSVLGGLITTLILVFGSVTVIYNAVMRLIYPVEIDYNGIIIFAIVGVVVNFAAAYFTHKGDSVNQRAVNLHMLEDVLGWLIVLIGSVVMKFTDIRAIDPILSVAVSGFLLFASVRNLKRIFDILLEKAPLDIDVTELKKDISEIEGVNEVTELYLHTLDGKKHFAALKISSVDESIFNNIKELLKQRGITKVIIEHRVST